MELKRQFIKTNKLKLVGCLRGDSDLILQYAHQEILTDDEYQALVNITNQSEVNRKIIDMVYFKGEETCVKFLDMLKEKDIQDTFPQLGQLLSSLPVTPPGENSSHASGGESASAIRGTSGACSLDDASAKIPDKLDFFKKNKSRLNADVTDIDRILDYLEERDFSKELAARVRAQPTRHDKMREILTVTTTKTLAGHLFDALVKYEKELMVELVDEYLNKK